MIRLAVIGGGSHSRENHLPALARYMALNRGVVEFAAFCDLRREVAEAIARQYAVPRFYTDLDAMLKAEALDGCLAVTPIPVTARVAGQLIAAGIPLLMEKPPGASLKEAEAICALVEKHRARAMVSMNRRFDPSIAAACAWRGARPIERIRATMLRHNRRDTDFFFGTAIHSVDAVRRMAGDVRHAAATSRLVDGVRWYHVDLEFASGAAGTLDVAPNCGSTAESYEVFGPGYRLLARVGMDDAGEFVAWEHGSVERREEPAAGMPPFVVNGAYGETVEFISALLENRPPHPTPAEVLQSVELCSRIQREVGTETSPPPG